MYRAMKKNCAIIANVTTSAIKLDPTKLRLPKRGNSTMGAATRCSMATNAVSSTTVAANRLTIAVELQPHELPSISPSTSAVRPTVSTVTPA